MSCREKDSSHVIRVPDVEVSKVFILIHFILYAVCNYCEKILSFGIIFFAGYTTVS